MQITHEQARYLIQYTLDGGISIAEKQSLDSHLMSCWDCQRYAESTKEMESILRPLLKRQWSSAPIPLSIRALTSRSDPKTSAGMIVATRMAAISVMLAVFLFGAWQFIPSKPLSLSPASVSVPPIPIPSTSTRLVSITQTQMCESIVYVVRQNDTIESLTDQFGIAKEEILAWNDMKTDRIWIGMKLNIPTCNYTPTANVSTTTFTPILSPVTSTPGG